MKQAGSEKMGKVGVFMTVISGTGKTLPEADTGGLCALTER